MSVVAKGWNMHGEPIVVEGSELLARAIQHETDHLDGIVFIDRLDEQTRKLAMKDIRESEWFSEALSSGNAPTIKVSPHSLFGKGF
jgi:peptide deformylase